MKTNTTPVIFRKYRDSGDILALFPTLPGSNNPNECSCYQHVGQHGSADLMTAISMTRPALLIEYTPLLTELKQLGYDDLEVRRRATRKQYTERQAAVV